MLILRENTQNRRIVSPITLIKVNIRQKPKKVKQKNHKNQ